MSIYYCLFYLFISHCHSPAAFMWSVIVPLVKARGGNMQHISNYTATALSNASSTISELVFKPYLKNEDLCDMYHFGFAPQLSTRVCTTTFKLCIECYTQLSSHVFPCFVHFSKACNTIIYCRLFNNLLQDKINCNNIIGRAIPVPDN